ncbi:MAG: universal stress protein [Alphaproteobacteria bacterium]|jgi:nucleotide-binding universal stress UspA family protein|nr:universal stress protein [Alphaproteobacteria bacterium]MBT7942234.1 universal stress protein [Alphaproteobacteria bacterium]
MIVDIRNILYCTDLSQNAAYAFRYAAQLASLSGSEIHILHVVEELSSDAKVTIQAYVMDDALRHKALEERVNQAEAYLSERLKKFWAEQDESDRGISKQIKSIDVCEAYPAEQILKTSVERDCDLIVIGAHEKGLAHNFLGGVAKSVLRRSRIPTLVVPIP